MKRLLFLGALFLGCMAQKSPPPPANVPQQESEKASKKSKESGLSPGSPNADPLAASPEITSGKAEIKGAMSPEEVSGVIKKSLPALKFCYDEARKKDPTLSGKMKVFFVIDGAGSVSEAKTTEGITDELDGCISRKFAQLKFPPPAGGGSVEVSYPLVLTTN